MKSIIFNQHQVNHALKNKEGMFRVVIKPYPVLSSDKSYWKFKDIRWAAENSSYARKFGDNARPEISELAPFQVGETIFVKEAWGIGSRPDQYGGYDGIEYRAEEQFLIDRDDCLNCYPLDYSKIPDDFDYDRQGWRAARSMPQWVSRLTLRIKSVKVERLQDISEEDCWKEGLDLDSEHSRLCFNIEEQPYSNDLINGSAIKTIFTKNWNSTHKKPEEKWEASPWVFAYEYEVVR